MDYAGLQIIESPYALEDTEERLFPVSKHRSKRIHKKLVKRYGGEFRKKPCLFRMGNSLLVHPAMMQKIRQMIPVGRAADLSPAPLFFTMQPRQESKEPAVFKPRIAWGMRLRPNKNAFTVNASS